MKTKFTLIVALTILIIPFAYAQDLILPSPGITPDSALWGLDLAMEKIQLALTRDPAAKVQKRMEIIDERLSEEKVMAEAGNEVAFDKAELRRQLDTAEIKSDLDDKDIKEKAEKLVSIGGKIIFPNVRRVEIPMVAIINPTLESPVSFSVLLRRFTQINDRILTNNRTVTTLAMIQPRTSPPHPTA